MNAMRPAGFACVVALLGAMPLRAAVAVVVSYLHVETVAPPVLSNLDPEPADIGLAGARVALADNRTTGQFLGQTYALAEIPVPVGEDALAAAAAALEETGLMLIDAPAETLLAIADLPQAEGAVLFNTAAPDGALRDDACRANMLHTAPSRAMLADALMQFMVRRQWDDLVMIAGSYPEDVAFAEALDRAARKFGLEVRDRKEWVFDADMRRNAADEVPLFTQDFGRYDVLLLADEVGDFARYVPFSTWEPRPVAGSEGLQPVAWAPVVEQWGAAQLQRRFEEQSGRRMLAQDYAAWAALRAIGEAVTRTNVADPAALRAFMLGPDFELAGFKGRPLTFRPWNGQLRQPIPLVHPRALVANAPLEGFLHQTTELDTLGIDSPESACAAFTD